MIISVINTVISEGFLQSNIGSKQLAMW